MCIRDRVIIIRRFYILFRNIPQKVIVRLSSPIFANDVSDPNGKKTRPNWSLPAFTDWLTCKTWFGVCFSLSLADWKTVLNLHSVIVWICDTSVRRRIHHLVLDCASTALDRTLPSPTHPHSDIHTHAHNYTHTHTHTQPHTHTVSFKQWLLSIR